MEALRGFERDGSLPDERQLESVLRLRMSPLVLIVAGYCMWVAERTHMPPEGTGSVETTVRGLVAGVGDACRFTGSADDAVLFTQALLSGDYDAAMEAEARGLLTVHNMVAMLHAVYLEEQLSEVELDRLLDRTEAWFEETQASGELLIPCVRNGAAGPWEVHEEVPGRRGELIDLGALKVPVVPRMRIRPKGEEGLVHGLVVKVGPDALKLQIYRMPEGSSWNSGAVHCARRSPRWELRSTKTWDNSDGSSEWRRC